MQFSANQIAQLAGGTVVGDGEVAVSTVAKIEEGHPGAISFLANPKYTHYIYETKSSVVLVRNDFEPERPVSATLIKVADPYATVAHLLQARGTDDRAAVFRHRDTIVYRRRCGGSPTMCMSALSPT